MIFRYFLGLDLGPAGEYTALAIVERPDRYVPPKKPVYNLRHLKRFDLGTPYPVIIAEVAAILSKAPMPGAWFIIDHTGVGRMVLKLFQEQLADKVRCTFCPVSIIASNVSNAIPQSQLQIPKQELVGTLQVLLQTRRLQVATGLPETTELVRELESYRLKPMKLAGESDEMWREGPRDDLVLAVALAAWCGEKRLPVMAKGGPVVCR